MSEKMKNNEEKIGLVLVGWDGNRLSEEQASDIASRLEFAEKLQRKIVLSFGELSPRVPEEAGSEPAASIKKNGFTKVIVGGCSPYRHKHLIEKLSRQTGLTESAFCPVGLSSVNRIKGDKKQVERAFQLINKAVDTLSLIPSFEEKTVSLNQNVLILGGGIAGIQTAAALNSHGYSTTLVEEKEELGGDLHSWVNNLKGAGDADFGKNLESIVIFTNSRLVRLTGHIGGFTAAIHTPSGVTSIEFGSVVLAPGVENRENWLNELLPEELSTEEVEKTDGHFVAVDELQENVESMPKLKKKRSIGIVLDVLRDETKAGTEMALTVAERIQEKNLFDAYLFLRDVRVSSLDLEAYYDEVREKGVNIVKYETIRFAPYEEGVTVICHDSVLNATVSVPCDIVGVSRYGCDFSVDEELAEMTGVDLDEYGQMQANNIHLFPGETNRQGVFVVGSARGTYYIPDILREAKAVAESVHTLLSQKTLTVELSNATVDPDKCILCLTCVRSCPYKAMEVDHEKGAAESNPEACRRCGICAGECPAKAIELPVYSDTIVMGQLA